MASSSSFDSDDDFIFGVDLSTMDVSQIVDEGETSLPTIVTYPQTPDYMTRIRDLLSRPRFPVLETPSTQKHFDDSFAWATSLGAELGGVLCVEDVYGGRCLLSQNQVEVGDVVAVLPRELRIGQTVACKRLGLPSDTPDLSALSLLLLDLVACENDDTDNLLHYVRCLPKNGSNGLFLSDEDVEYYGSLGKKYVKAINAIRNQAIGCVDYIHEVLAGENSPAENDSTELLWAISMIQSRTHGFGTNRNRWITAIFDLCNHSPRPNCKLEGDSQGRLVLRAVRPIAANEEITIDYQADDDTKVVATYGFSLVHPPRQSI